MKFNKGDLVKTCHGIGEILYINESMRFPYLIAVLGHESYMKIENCEGLIISPANEGHCCWYSEEGLELVEKRNGLTNEERRIEIVKKIMEVYDIKMNRKFNMVVNRKFQPFYINKNYRLVDKDDDEWQRGFMAFLYNPEQIRKIPTKRMTLENIEEKLGYKIILVDKDGGANG